MSITRNGITYSDLKNGSTGKWSVRGGREYTITVQALTTNPRVGPQAIFSNMGLRFGSYYSWPVCSAPTEWDGGSFVQDMSLSRDSKDGLKWTITLEYTPYDVNHEGGATDGLSYDGKVNPFLMPPKVNWTSNKVDRSWPIDFTTTGPPDYTPAPRPYVNAAGDPLEDPPKTEDAHPVITIVRNEQYYDPNVVVMFKNTCNQGIWLAAGSLPGLNDLFAGYSENVAKCLDISAERVYDADWGVYWIVTYQFEFKFDTWAVKLLNAGTRSLGKTTPGTNITQIVTADGAAVSSPVCLKSDGTFDPTNPPAPNYLTFQPYVLQDFSALGIPWQIFVSGPTA